MKYQKPNLLKKGAIWTHYLSKCTSIFSTQFIVYLLDKIINGWSFKFTENIKNAQLQHSERKYDELNNYEKIKINNDFAQDMNNGFLIKTVEERNIIPLFLGPKYKSNGAVVWRLIRDAKRKEVGTQCLNHFMTDENATTAMPQLITICAMCMTIGVGGYLFKRDLKNAFRLLGLVKEEWSYLCYRHRGKKLTDTRQVWGTRTACKYCNELGQVVCQMFIHIFGCKEDMVQLKNFVDDFIGGAKGKAMAAIYTETLAMFCNELGLDDNINKPEGPVRIIKLTGFYYRMWPRLTVSLPRDKKAIMIVTISLWLINQMVDTMELESLMGSLYWSCSLVWPMKAFCRRLTEWSTQELLKQHGQRYHRWIPLIPWVEKDLKIHRWFLLQSNEVDMVDVLKVRKTTLIGLTDGATNGSREKGTWCPGIGGILYNINIQNGKWFSAYLPTPYQNSYFEYLKNHQKKFNIQHFEMISVITLIHTYTKEIVNHESRGIMVFNDNKPIVWDIINKSAKDEFLMACISWLIMWSVKNKTWFTIHDIRTHDNFYADALSRFDLKRFHELANENNNHFIRKSSDPIFPNIWDY